MGDRCWFAEWRLHYGLQLQPAGRLDRPASRPIRCHEHPHPGDLVHLEVKKLGRIPTRGTVHEADWAGVEPNADNFLDLTLNTLRGEASIDRGRTAPYAKLQGAHAAATGR
jgi:hypothetical protein